MYPINAHPVRYHTSAPYQSPVTSLSLLSSLLPFLYPLSSLPTRPLGVEQKRLANGIRVNMVSNLKTPPPPNIRVLV